MMFFKKKSIEPAVDSIPLRLIVFTMTLGFILIGSFLFHSHILYGFLCVWLAIMGSYMSWTGRHQTSVWTNSFISIAIVASAANLFRELVGETGDHVDILSAVVRWLLVV
ncbi:MAG: hypothetical protein ACRD3W_24445, partial [Terriglobales bacterium]